jgi:hypothetical protein
VPARGIDKELAIRFLQPTLPEVLELVGLALPDSHKRKPAAAFAAPAAGGGMTGNREFHTRWYVRRWGKHCGKKGERFSAI